MSNQIKEHGEYAKKAYIDVVKDAETANVKTDKMLNLLGLRLPEIPMNQDLKNLVDATLEEFIKDPSQWIAGGNINAMQIFQKLYKSSVTMTTMRDFCVIYIASGKNFSKMVGKGSKTSNRSKLLKKVTRGLNIRTPDNTSGYQPEAIAGALSPFMCMMRVIIGDNNLIPPIDIPYETTNNFLHKRFRWIGSLIAIPIGGDMDKFAKSLRDYDDFVQKYIERRAKDPNAQKDPITAQKANERRTINRSFYNSIIGVFSDKTKTSWATDHFTIPEAGTKLSKLECQKIETFLGWRMSRDEDFKV